MTDSKSMPLTQRHETADARIVNFFGWKVPATFGNPEAEYAAARGAVALHDASYLTVVSAKGKDLLDYLNRRLSQRVIDLQPGEALRANQLGGDGRMEADMEIFCVSEDDCLLVAPPGVGGEYLAALCDKYVFSEDVTFTDQTGERAILAIVGPRRSEVAQAVGIQLPEGEHRIASATLQETEALVFDSAFIPDAILLAIPSDSAMNVLQTLLADVEKIGGCMVGLIPFDTLRVEAGIPWWGIDLTERSIPLDADLMSAIHTNKGCYPGQETIAKILNLGHPARKLVGLLFDSDEPPPAGSSLQVEGREVGTISSSTWSPRLKKAIGLATVRWQYREPGTELSVSDTGKATVGPLPFG